MAFRLSLRGILSPREWTPLAKHFSLLLVADAVGSRSSLASVRPSFGFVCVLPKKIQRPQSTQCPHTLVNPLIHQPTQCLHPPREPSLPTNARRGKGGGGGGYGVKTCGRGYKVWSEETTNKSAAEDYDFHSDRYTGMIQSAHRTIVINPLYACRQLLTRSPHHGTRGLADDYRARTGSFTAAVVIRSGGTQLVRYSSSYAYICKLLTRVALC